MRETDFVRKIKELEKQIKELQKGRLVINLTIPDDGTFRVPTGASDPATGNEVDGQLFFNTTSGKLKVWVTSAWVAVH